MRRLLILLVALFGATLPAVADTKFIYAGTLIAIPGEEPLKEQTVVVKQGRIVRRYVGEPDFAELHAEIERLLAQT